MSKLAGVSVKTLHHYDEKGLLVPFRQQANGYRVYTQNHLVRLQQIIIYRELDFSIEAIKSLVQSSDDQLLDTLSHQKSLLIQRQQTLSKMINSLEVTMDSIKGKENYDILFEDIPKEKTERWGSLSQERYSKEESEKQMSVLAKLSEQQMREFKEESDKVTLAFAETIGMPFDCTIVQQLTDEHYQMTNNFNKLVARENGYKDIPDLGYEEYVGMANSVDLTEVNELCEHFGEGYSEHARQAMIYYAEQRLMDDKIKLKGPE
ncbi:MerR family transcriptional regulator [Thalassotalea sp. M1531]|uniref:MerR family transcriptional regulator n=1 Tax=Thalassotalea algicola TaxID=2716224 RepID=A0A7Y0Q8B1_9GAMM|nr:MerR family transcriptional regulator [Thalassotalea algicola]